MSDDIFIKQDQVIGQQPYIARVPKNAQEPVIRQTQQPNIRITQIPSTYQNRTPTTYQDPRSAQEPNIRSAQEPNIRDSRQPFTYQHRSPLTYDHRSPFTYDHRSPTTYQHRSPSTYRDPRSYQNPSTYDHRSPSTYRNPVAYRNPFTYQHRSPSTYQHREPHTYDHRSPFTYDHRSPSTYQNREPHTYDHRSPFTYDYGSPFTYNHPSPFTFQAQQPVTYNHPSPYEGNVQTPVIYQNPVIFDGIDGDSTGQATGFSAPNWVTTFHTQRPEGYPAETHATLNFAYQKGTTSPYGTGTSGDSSNGERGSVHMKYHTGGSNAYALIYYNVVSIGDEISGYPTGVTPDVNDTWAVHVKYTASGQTANHSGYTYSQSPNNGGSGFTSGTYYALYTGSSSNNSFDGTTTNRSFFAKASTGSVQQYQPRSAMTSISGLSWTLRLSKSGQTSIFTTMSVSGFGINLTASSGVPIF